jgi:phage virion morphogenesis protein
MTLLADISGLDAMRGQVSQLTRLHTDRLLARLGEIIEDATLDRIRSNKSSPTGGSWPQRTSGGAHPLLEKSGALMRSITSFVRGDQAEIGSPLPYARVHQFGSRRLGIPARPFLGLSEADEIAVERVAIGYLEEVLRA